MYSSLWTKTNFSFLEGASHPEELVEEARAQGLHSLAVTDRDGVYGVVRAHVAARDAGLRLIIGSEVTVAAPGDNANAHASTPVLLCQNRKGYANLCGLVTVGRRRSDKGKSIVTWQEVTERAEGLLLLLHDDPGELPAAGVPRHLAMLGEAFAGRVYGLVARHEVDEEVPREARLRAMARRMGWPLVGAVEVLYHSPARRPLQDVMTAIRHGVPLCSAGRLLKPNAGFSLLPPFAFARRFADDPALVRRTLEIAERCTFNMGELRYHYPAEKLPSGFDEEAWLRELTSRGARDRFPSGVPDKVAAQLEKELDLIATLQYGGYFLTMWEIVQFCRRSDILCQGRGSAANSAVCYCLGVTAVDPLRMDLLFERFLSLERAEPPDIDLDIEHERREEVIQWVYGRYGRTHAAMVANLIRYRPRSAVRDIGKALGLPETALDRLSKLLNHYADEIDPAVLVEAGLNSESKLHQLLLQLSAEIQDFPRHLSIHPGGFLLGHDPVDTLVPIENATMEGRTVIQWDKNDIEDLGLFKVDLLGLGALHQVHLCLDLMREDGGPDLTPATIPAEDPETYDMISNGDTVGVFQIESRAQMNMLPRLRPRVFYDLVIEVAIIRPGPITGGMVHPYLRRRHGIEPILYPHPSLEPVLSKTLGVPLFQEQVMKLAMVAADYTPGEADQLRRDMAAWRKVGRIEKHRDRLVERMSAKGIEREFAERVFEQIRGFGEYGFPESHAASFALISYVTAWLKCHHPAEFLCSLLNAQPMGFYSPATLIEDAKRHNVEVRPVCVLRSGWKCKIEWVDRNDGVEANVHEGSPHTDGPRRTAEAGLVPAQAAGEANAADGFPEGAAVETAPALQSPPSRPVQGGRSTVRMGLHYVKGLGSAHRVRIEKAMAEEGPDAGPFRSVDDFARRTGLDRKALDALAEAGAFAGLAAGGTKLHRREALWQARAAATRREETVTLARIEDLPLFAPLSAREEVGWDYRRTQHSTRGHLMGELREDLRALGLPTAAEIAKMKTGKRVRYTGVVICRQRPGTAKGVTFYTLEDETGFVNLVVWKAVYERHKLVAKTAVLLGVDGHIEAQGQVVNVIADRLWEVEMNGTEAALEGFESRDWM